VRTPPPVSAAWRPGDPPGRRQFLDLATDRAIALDGGGALRDVTIAYETWGTLDSVGGNAILVCHAWTGDSHVAGPIGPGHPTGGWWEGMVGPGLALDTDRYFIVCSNVIGGCQGSTGPSSIESATGRPYGPRFPVVTIRDMVRVQAALATHLGIPAWFSVIGGSMGGMQVLEWGITFPNRVRSLIPVATTAQATAQQIAWNAVGRRAVRLDPAFRGGEYYDADPGGGPHEGMAIARMLAQVTFRSDDVFTDRFGRELADRDGDGFALWQRFEVERYLDHHGDKLVRRFDANSYLLLSKAMDLHDVARGRGSLEAAMSRIKVPTLAIGIWSDQLYPSYQQKQIREVLHRNGTPAEYVEIDSPHGHDSFLLDLDQVGGAVATFLESVEKDAADDQ
jgi:homoserine O-acetyltransferase